jgi:hypothetical protein
MLAQGPVRHLLPLCRIDSARRPACASTGKDIFLHCNEKRVIVKASTAYRNDAASLAT